MLGKLIKHEWKAVSKILMLIHVALIAMAVVGKILLSIEVLEDASLLWGSLLMVYVISVMAIALGTHIFLAVRFYKNMYTDEGYLSFTLPAKPWEHLFAKTLVSSIWILIDGITLGVSIVILVAYKGMGTEFVQFWNEMILFLQSADGFKVAVLLIEILICMIVTLVSAPLIYYFSISIGQLFQNHKLLASVIAFVIIKNVMEVLSTIISAVFLAGKALIAEEMEYTIGNFNELMLIGILVSGVTCAIFWFGNHYIMSKHLNLS